MNHLPSQWNIFLGVPRTAALRPDENLFLSILEIDPAAESRKVLAEISTNVYQ